MVRSGSILHIRETAVSFNGRRDARRKECRKAGRKEGTRRWKDERERVERGGEVGEAGSCLSFQGRLHGPQSHVGAPVHSHRRPRRAVR